MNIVGENFPEEIVKQIKVRQEKKGSKNRNPGGDPSLLVWQNANTGWVKMISSVDINKEQRLKASNNEMAETILPDNKLAKKYVLFGGVYEQGKGKEGLRGGIERNRSILNDSAYGLGGTEFGLRPMPGITSFSIKTETRGSLKTATIGIKCYNRHQFDIINTLYLSLGYSVLIEWGNTMYYDNKGVFKHNDEIDGYSLADEFLNGKYKWNNILDKIRENRLASCGNYDASLGKVVNFRWSINRDLTYDITVTVRSVGDVIESLKMNALSGYINVSLSEQQLVALSTQNGGAISNPVNDIPDRITAWQTIERIAIAVGSPDPKLTAAIAMNESGWLKSSYYKNGNNAFGQTITDRQIGTEGIVGKVVIKSYDGKTRLFAKYDNLESSVKHHLRRWKQYYVPGNAEQSTRNLVQAGYNTAEKQWAPVINTIYNKRKNLPPLSGVGAAGSTTGGAAQTQSGVGVAGGASTAGSATSPTQTNQSPGIVSQFNTFIQNVQTAVSGGVFPVGPSGPTAEETINKYAYTHDIGALFYNTMTELNNGTFPSNSGSIDAVKIDFAAGGPNSVPQYYVRLGYFLQQLEENIIYKLKGTTDRESKIIKFDYDTDSNIILLYGRQLSANPNVCIFKRKYILADGGECIIFPELNDFLLAGSGNTYKSFYGKIMNAYFSMSYILDQIEANKNGETGVLTLIDLLKIITQGFCKSTGNYNKLEPIVDEETNTIKIIDDVKLPDGDSILKSFKTNSPSELANFKMYGYYATNKPNTSLAGIVRDLNFTTTVSPNLATMITIGAQANGYVTGQDSTALSVMNYGLKDRVKEEWIEPTNPNTYPQPATPSNTQPFVAPLAPQSTQVQPWNPFSPQSQQTTTQTPQPASPLSEKYNGVIKEFNRFIQGMSFSPPIWNQNDVDAFSNSIQSFAEYDQAEITLKERQINAASSSPSIGFLPFDITLTIDGLSGMKVYQKYITDTDFLPSNYPSSLEFLIKGITHEIKDNQWITTLESIAVPKNPFGGSIEISVGERVTGQTSPTQTPIVAQARAGTARPTGFTANTSTTACGTTSLTSLPAPTITQQKINALVASFNSVYQYGNGPGGRCARYTYNLAYNYTQALRGGKLSPGAKIAAGGNANQPGYFRKLTQLGYQQIDWGKNLPKSKVIDLLENSSNLGVFSPGDVVVYFSNDGKKFHTQMFTGGYTTPGYYWATDKTTNYKSGFVYKSKPQNCYTIYLFRAPNA